MIERLGKRGFGSSADPHLAKQFARAGDRVALFVEQLLDQHDRVDVVASIEPLLAARLCGAIQRNSDSQDGADVSRLRATGQNST
jgi:hypothetical protein